MVPLQEQNNERHITSQLLNIWNKLTHDKMAHTPSLKNLRPEDIEEFRSNIVLFDLREKEKDPIIAFIGSNLTHDLPEDLTGKSIINIPSHSLARKMADHYLDAIPCKEVVLFDSKFIGSEKKTTSYQGILLPFSDDGNKIDSVIGGIIETAEENIETKTIPLKLTEKFIEQEQEVSTDFLEKMLKEYSKVLKSSGHRSRKSLYNALGNILDFYHITETMPKNYTALLKEHNLKSQKRAPFTPILKIVFGKAFDQTRLTEYSRALKLAYSKDISGKDFASFIKNMPGGIKGCVKASRAKNNPKIAQKIDTRNEILKNIPIINHFEDYISKNLIERSGYCIYLARKNKSHVEILKHVTIQNNLLEKLLNQVTDS